MPQWMIDLYRYSTGGRWKVKDLRVVIWDSSGMIDIYSILEVAKFVRTMSKIKEFKVYTVQEYFDLLQDKE